MKNIKRNELRIFSISEKEAGFVIVNDIGKDCKNCGRKVYVSDFCDEGCFLDWKDNN